MTITGVVPGVMAPMAGADIPVMAGADIPVMAGADIPVTAGADIPVMAMAIRTAMAIPLRLLRLHRPPRLPSKLQARLIQAGHIA